MIIKYHSLFGAIKFPTGILFLIPKTEKMVQVVYTLEEYISQVKSLSVTYDVVFKEWSAKEEEHNVVLITGSLHVRVNKTSGSISFYDTQIKFINLRYKLMPYIYSLAGAVTVDYGTIMNPLGMEFPDDENTYDITNEYMFGPSILVCPITEP